MFRRGCHHQATGTTHVTTHDNEGWPFPLHSLRLFAKKKSKRAHAAWRAYLRVAKQKEVATALTKANENRTKTERKLLQKSENRENRVLKKKEGSSFSSSNRFSRFSRFSNSFRTVFVRFSSDSIGSA